MQLKRIIRIIINSALLIPFIMVMSTVFMIDKGMANGTVSGKYFWFYLSLIYSSVGVILSFCLSRRKITYSLSDLLITVFCISGLAISYFLNETISNKWILLLLIWVLYFYFRIFLAQFRSNIYTLIVFFVFTGLVEAIWGLMQLYGFLPSQHGFFKITGSFFNPGPYAGYLAMVIPVAFYYLLNDSHIFKSIFRPILFPFYIRWGISLLSFFSIVLVLPATLSRASWIAAMSGCLVIGCLYLLKTRKTEIYIRRIRKKWGLILIGVIVLLIGVLAGTYHLKKDSADGRILIWKISLKLIPEHPFGVGLGNFVGVYGEKQAEYFASVKGTEQEQLIAGNPEYAFNEYLQVCIEFGVIPFLLFIFIIVYTIYTGFRKKRYAVVGGLVSLMVFASMSYPFSILPFLISLVFLLAVCTTNEPENLGIYKSKHFFQTGLFLVMLFVVSSLSIYNRYPLYEAYQKWNTAKILHWENFHKQAAKEYARLYPYLDHEIHFLFEYAQSLSKSEQYEESNLILEKAIKISCDPMLYNVMGKNYQAVGKYVLAEECFIISSLIVPSRLYPYYLLAKLYAEPDFYDKDKLKKMSEIVLTKEPKVYSTAIEEMREEIQKINAALDEDFINYQL